MPTGRIGAPRPRAKDQAGSKWLLVGFAVAVLLTAAAGSGTTCSPRALPETPGAALGAGLVSGDPPSSPPFTTAAASFPWTGLVADNGTNTTGVSLFLGNITIPAADPDQAGFNYTVWLGAATSNCLYGQAGVENGQGIWKFHWSFDPIAGIPTPPVQGWWGHLAPGDTYQVVLNLTGSAFEEQLFNVSAGHYWEGSLLAPDLVATAPVSALSLLVGPSFCAARPTSLGVGITVGASPLAKGGLSRDYFVQDEAIEVGRSGPTSAVPNLWQPLFQGAPADFAPQQSWSTTSLASVLTDHPSVVEQVTTSPPSNVDVGQAIAVGVVGVPRIVPGGPNANTEAITKVEFAGYPATGPLTFATCPASAQNGSASNAGYPGGDPGLIGEYGYSTNTTPTRSDVYLSYAGGAGPPITTNMSLGLRCYTGPLTTPGYLDVFGLSYLQYDLPSSSPSQPFVGAPTWGPQDFLGMNALFWNVTVNALPSLGISVTPSNTVLVGQNAVLSASRVGGSPSFTYTWYVDGTIDGTCTTTSCSKNWPAPGSHVVWASVVDAYGARAVSAHENLTVVAAPTVTISPMTAAASVGTPISLAAMASAGSGRFTYNFSLNGSANPVQSGPVGTLTYTPVHGGVYQVWVEVNDSNHDIAVSTHANLTVAEGVAVALVPATPVTEVGLSPVLFTASAVGGAGGYTFAWNHLGLSVGGPCLRQCNLSSSTPATYEVWVVVTDSAGRLGVSPHANLTVLAPPSFVSWSGPANVDQGTNDTWTASFAGGDAPFAYAWSFYSTPVPYCSRSSSCSVLATAPGTLSFPFISVVLTDALGATAASPGWMVNISVPLTVALAPAPATSAEVGLAVSLHAVASAGVPGYAYGYLSSAAPSAPAGVGSSGTYAWTPSSPGPIQLWAEVNDSTGFRAVSAHANVTVVAALSIVMAPTPTASVAAGSTLLATALPTGGLPPLTYAWMEDGAAVAACTAVACGFEWTTVGSHAIWVDVVDALGVRGASPHTNVSVGPTSHPPPPPVFEVSLGISPSGAGGQVQVGSTPYVAGNVAAVAAGTYVLVYTSVGSLYSFKSWSSSGGVSVASTSQANTTLSVTANGTLTAILASKGGGGPLGLSTASLEVLGGLALVLALLIVIGVRRHRTNQRNTRVVPPPRRTVPTTREGASWPPGSEEPPGD